MSLILSGNSGSLTVDSTAGITFPAGSNPQAAPSKVLQVVSQTYSTQVSNSSTSYTDTGSTVSITPLFSTSKIAIFVTHNGINIGNSSSGLSFQLLKNSSSLTVFGTNFNYGVSNNPASISFNYVDSPATTLATTYKTQFATTNNSNTSYVNSSSGVSTIIVMEIAA